MARIYGLLHAGLEFWNFHNPSWSGEADGCVVIAEAESVWGEEGRVESGNAGFRLVSDASIQPVRSPTFSARVRSATESWRRILISSTTMPHHLPEASDTEAQPRKPTQIHRYTNTQMHKYRYTNTWHNICPMQVTRRGKPAPNRSLSWGARVVWTSS